MKKTISRSVSKIWYTTEKTDNITKQRCWRLQNIEESMVIVVWYRIDAKNRNIGIDDAIERITQQHC